MIAGGICFDPTAYPETVSADSEKEKFYSEPAFPSVSPSSSVLLSKTEYPKHRFLDGSIHHPNPPTEDRSFQVDEDNRTVRVGGAHQLNAFRDWAQERYFEAKFSTLDKRFTEIEKSLAALGERLKEVEKRLNPAPAKSGKPSS